MRFSPFRPTGELPVEYVSLTVFHWPRQGHAVVWLSRIAESGSDPTEHMHMEVPIGPISWHEPMADAVDRFVDECSEMLGWQS